MIESIINIIDKKNITWKTKDIFIWKFYLKIFEKMDISSEACCCNWYRVSNKWCARRQEELEEYDELDQADIEFAAPESK